MNIVEFADLVGLSNREVAIRLHSSKVLSANEWVKLLEKDFKFDKNVILAKEEKIVIKNKNK